ncbi:MAG: hypothetical protein P8Y53_13295 [Pseudolabrys sp.]|jgi:hypothetical protein
MEDIREMPPKAGGRLERPAQKGGRSAVSQQRRPVREAARRPVAEDLAPAMLSGTVHGAHQQRRAVGHGAEGGDDRPRDRAAVGIGFETVQFDRHGHISGAALQIGAGRPTGWKD